ncbi:MAG: winged helix-turn-helix domain-containing protein [Olleya sp.]
MRKQSLFISTYLIVFGLFLLLLSCKKETNTTLTETTKLALRDVGHHLLLSNQDSTSLVKPVLVLGNYKYQLSFENQLSIHPDTLVKHIKTSFEKTNLPNYYLTEVIKCKNQQVAYSYEMKRNTENGIIPCGGRQLHKGCYLVTVRFTKLNKTKQSNTLPIVSGLLAVLGFIIFKFLRRKPKSLIESNQDNYKSIGHYKFYPEQNILIKEAREISLSKKECELLTLFIAKPNQIIKRDELTKKVWEDHGVFVGRSLDTYISKLRKKLQDDDSIKLTNVHGVGYKLEV